jgi:pyocin large subunit-like protein
MRNFSRRFILKFLLFVLVGVSSSLSYQPDLAAWDSTAVQAHDFAPGRLEEHYQKHGYQFGQITQEQYLHGAQALLDAEPGQDVLEKIRPDGDIEHFRVSTGEFAVMTKRGRIRTYFKTNYGYWLTRQ